MEPGKSAFIVVVGRPSSGKSTLVNRMCGHKVSIVDSSPQTTRNAVRGIRTTPRAQLVFVDTPGFHTSERRFNNHMTRLISESFDDIDIVLYLIDVTRPPGREEEELRSLVRPYADRLVIGLNKIDADGSTGEHLKALGELAKEDRVFRISGLSGEGMDSLIAVLEELAPPGEQYYPEEFYTDQDPEFRVAEIIREKAINRMKKELPHSIYVEISDMEQSESGDDLWIRAFLMVERESQKGIVVGKKGSVIRAIRTEALKELHELFPHRIDLDLRVKVSKDWRKNDHLLRRLIH